MKKKIFITALVVSIAILSVFGAATYKEIKLREKVDNVVSKIIAKEVELKNVDYSSLGKYGEDVKAFGEAFIKYDANVANLESEFKKYDIMDFLDKKYLENPAEGKEHSKRFFEVLPNFEVTLTKDLEKLKEGYGKIPLPEKDKKTIYETLDKLNADTLNEFKPLATNFKTLSPKIDNFYDFMISRKGKYVLEGDVVSFYSAQDVDKYKELLKDIMATAQELKY